MKNLLLFFTLICSHFTYCSDVCRNIISSLVLNNNFKTGRTLPEYAAKFSGIEEEPEGAFITDISRAKHVIDGGSGDGNFIINVLNPDRRPLGYEYYPALDGALDSPKPLEEKPNFTAISYVMKNVENNFNNEGIKSKIHLMSGRFFEDIPLQEITQKFGKADVIVDLFGILSYTRDLSFVLNRYLELLKTDGIIYLHSKNATQIVLSDKARMSLVYWISSQGRGIEVKTQKFGQSHYSTFSIKIIKKSSDAHVPNLEEISYEERIPPTRIFQQIDND